MSNTRWAKTLGLTAAMLCSAGLAQAAPAFVYAGASDELFRIKFTGVTTETNTVGDETTWGWGYVSDIRNDVTNALRWQPENPAFGNATISFMLYGIADLAVNPGGTNGFEIYNVGCTAGACDGKIHIDFYIDDITTNGGTNPGFNDLTPASRTGFNTLTGVTDGALLMRWELTPGGILDDPATIGVDESQATLFQDVSGATLPATGNGFFYADCVDGDGCAKLGPQLSTWPGGVLAELFGKFTLIPTDGAVATAGWGGLINDPVLGVTQVPEPAAIGAFGAALLALVGLSHIRRRSA